MQEILTGGQTVLWYLPGQMVYLNLQERIFSHDDRRRAQNNQEYAAWAFLPMDVLVYWSAWEELSFPRINFIRERRIFVFWFTLALFECHTFPNSIKVEQYIEKTVKLAKQCGGGADDNDQIFELAVEAFESSSWGCPIVPHLGF